MTSSPSAAGGPFGSRDVRSLYPAITDNHLRYLEKWGLLRPRARGSRREPREYSFSELATIKQVAGEIEKGTPLNAVLRALVAERQGQLELDFHAPADAPRAKVVALEPRKSRGDGPGLSARSAAAGEGSFEGTLTDPQAALAARYFVDGSRLDAGDERQMDEAAAAYRKALIIDTDLVPAIVNLANIHYARDELIEAHALYERAIGLDPECFEAHFNLGNILHDLGRFDGALLRYRRAVTINPGYPDAHFYLAVTLEKTGHSPEAKPHWSAYLELAPQGEWADLAKEFLD